jgi:hypothetical protein
MPGAPPCEYRLRRSPSSRPRRDSDGARPAMLGFAGPTQESPDFSRIPKAFFGMILLAGEKQLPRPAVQDRFFLPGRSGRPPRHRISTWASSSRGEFGKEMSLTSLSFFSKTLWETWRRYAPNGLGFEMTHPDPLWFRGSIHIIRNALVIVLSFFPEFLVRLPGRCRATFLDARSFFSTELPGPHTMRVSNQPRLASPMTPNLREPLP